MSNFKKTMIYLLTIILSIVYIFFGNKIATSNLNLPDNGKGEIAKAVILEIMDRTETPVEIEGLMPYKDITLTFRAELTSGASKGEHIIGTQNISTSFPVNLKETKIGDKVYLINSTSGDDYSGEDGWYIAEYTRTMPIIVLSIIFALCILLFGKKKGFNTLLSLTFTCLSVFVVFVPAVLSGHNIYIWSIITCLFIISMTLIIVNGINKKSLSAGLGCIGGITIAGFLTLIMDFALGLTGLVNEDSLLLMYLDTPIDLKAIVFGAILLGAIGAIMDVAIDIASALKELSEKAEDNSFHSLFGSGLNIGKDILGTMANTLVLAYMGSSLSVVLLLVAYNSSNLGFLLNSELAIVEILQALVGSFGIFFTIPLTAFFASKLYTQHNIDYVEQ